jgi:hypothetical protein
VDDAGEPLFQTVLFFRCMERAMEILSFDAMFLVLYNILSLTGADALSVSTRRRTMPPNPNVSPIPPVFAPVRRNTSTITNPLILPGQCGSLDDLAREICRLVDYCLHGKYDSLGAFTLLFPLRVAYKTLLHERTIIRWLERMSRDIADSRGFGIGIHILNQPNVSRLLVP